MAAAAAAPKRAAGDAAIVAEHPAPRKLPKGVDAMRRGPYKWKRKKRVGFAALKISR